MKLNNKSIELFGISGSGKTYLRRKIKSKLSSHGYKLLDAREIIINYIDKFVQLGFYQKIKIFYFKILLKLNIKPTLWDKDLYLICKKFLNKNKEKNKKYEKIKKLIFNNKKLLQKKIYHLWIDELIVASIIFEKLSKVTTKLIFLPDEGFIQRIFILAYSRNNFNSEIIKKYLKCKINCSVVINVVSSRNKIKSTISNRKVKNLGWIASRKQITDMEKIEKLIKKHGKLINIFYIRSNNNTNYQILKILKINNLI